jgi:hypothetical protein
MSVPISNVLRRVVYEASGTGPYAFTFEILAATDIAVYKDDDILTLTTDYTVTINSNGTGSVTLTASPVGATQISIVGDRSIQRSTDFVTGGDFFANSLNDELDSQTIFAQQNAEAIVRCMRAPETDPISIDMVLPRASVRANKYLAFDNDGNPAPGEVPSGLEDVLAISTEIETVAGIDTEVTTLAGLDTEIAAIYAALPDVQDTATALMIDEITAVSALNIDCSLGRYFTKTISANSTFTVSNVPSAKAYCFVLELTHTSGTITWFSGVEWPNGSAPTLTTGKTHLFMFLTDDGGTRWRASVLRNYTN